MMGPRERYGRVRLAYRFAKHSTVATRIRSRDPQSERNLVALPVFKQQPHF